MGSQISDCRLTSMLPTKAPKAFAKNGLRMKLNTKPAPVFLALCPETMSDSHELVALLRSQQRVSVEGEDSVSRSPIRHSPKAAIESHHFEVFSLRSGQSVWKQC